MDSQTNEFDIDENTGQIFTVSVAGKAGTFHLEVQATDQGTTRLTAWTTVSVRKMLFIILICFRVKTQCTRRAKLGNDKIQLLNTTQ